VQEAEMLSVTMSRRALFRAALAAFGAYGLTRGAPALAGVTEIKVPDNVPEEKFDFDTQGIASWTTVDGQWAVEGMEGAPSGRNVLMQRATKNEFTVIVTPGGPYGDVGDPMKFKPVAGREDASAGIVFRLTDGKYYVARANALEDNFRLYAYDRGRRQLATARVKAPALGQWHTLRLVAVGDHIQAWLDGALQLDHHDSRFTVGRVGLWTTADSIA